MNATCMNYIPTGNSFHGYTLSRQWSIIWYVWNFTKLHLKLVQKRHLGTGIIIHHSFKQIIFENYRFLPLYTSRIGIFSNIQSTKNDILFEPKNEPKFIMGMFRKGTRLVSPLNDWNSIRILCIDWIVNNVNFRNINERNVHRFIFDLQKHYDFNHCDVKVVIQLYPPWRQRGILISSELTINPFVNKSIYHVNMT